MDTFDPLLVSLCKMILFEKIKLSGVSESDTADYAVIVDLCAAEADGRALIIREYSIVHRRNVGVRHFERPPAGAGRVYRALILRLEEVCQIDFVGDRTD